MDKAYSLAEQINIKELRQESLKLIDDNFCSNLSRILPFLYNLKKNSLDLKEYNKLFKKAKKKKYYLGAEKQIKEISELIDEKEYILSRINEIIINY